MDEAILTLWATATVLFWQVHPLCGIAVGFFLYIYVGRCLLHWLQNKKSTNSLNGNSKHC